MGRRVGYPCRERRRIASTLSSANNIEANLATHRPVPHSEPHGEGSHHLAARTHVSTVIHMAVNPTLVNLTRKPKFVVADGVLLQLPQAPKPRVLEITSPDTSRSLTVFVGDVEAQLSCVGMTGNLVSSPPVINSVLWLVDTDVFAQFPHRHDFIRPTLYTLVSLNKLDWSSIEESVLTEASMFPGSIMVLTGVSRSPLVASATASRLEDLDVDVTVEE